MPPVPIFELSVVYDEFRTAIIFTLFFALMDALKHRDGGVMVTGGRSNSLFVLLRDTWSEEHMGDGASW
jgi:hypothetical protein